MLFLDRYIITMLPYY